MSNSFKNFILFCYATLISAGIFMLAAMIFDQIITTPDMARTPQFGMTPYKPAIFYLSAFLLIAVCGLVVAFKSRLNVKHHG